MLVLRQCIKQQKNFLKDKNESFSKKRLQVRFQNLEENREHLHRSIYLHLIWIHHKHNFLPKVIAKLYSLNIYHGPSEKHGEQMQTPTMTSYLNSNAPHILIILSPSFSPSLLPFFLDIFTDSFNFCWRQNTYCACLLHAKGSKITVLPKKLLMFQVT